MSYVLAMFIGSCMYEPEFTLGLVSGVVLAAVGLTVAIDRLLFR